MENYRGLYKVPSKVGRLDESKRGEKRETVLRQQKKKREDTFFKKRNITEESVSPAAPVREKTVKDTRRDKLLRWKVEKERLVAQQKLQERKKPPFKVGVAHHTLDPTKEFAPPVRATTVKCTTAKKSAAVTRADAVEIRKAKPPTAAATSLATLSAPVANAEFSGRVTRSRTAAASSKAPPKSVVETKPKTKSTTVSRVNGTSSKNLKTGPKVPPAKSNTDLYASSSKSVKASTQKGTGGPKAFNLEREQSFAPKDHKFKAPASLTFPTTPLTLKRKRATAAAAAKGANWPSIPGVSLLKDSPIGLSPPKLLKSDKPAASQRKGRLSRAVKDRTPKKELRCAVEIETSPVTHPSHKTRSAFITTDVSEEDMQVNTVESQMSMKSPKQDKPMKNDRKSTRMSLRSTTDVFIVTEISDSGVVKDNEEETASSSECDAVDANNTRTTADVAERKSEDLLMTPSASKPITPRKSTVKKSHSSMKEKENIPEENNEIFHTVDHSDSFNEMDVMESVVMSSRRMSIHEPTPSVDITPDKLVGMVPAQFSPYITSARGKDKYSTQKRRDSLIPVVPDISAEEVAKTNQIEHFRNLLERESSRLLTLSNLWEDRKGEAPSHVQDVILGPIGQARLLVKDKFQQFRRLVDKFEIGETEGKITTDDLTGFWEMMLLTVENVDKRFKELEDLKTNNWEEHISEVPVKKTVAPVTSKPVKAPAAQSRIKALIEAARKRKQQKKSANASKDVTTFDGGFFRVESPKKVLPSPKVVSKSSPLATSKAMSTTPLLFQRRSLLQHVLTNSAVRAQQSPNVSVMNRSLPLSPSPKVAIAQIRASELGKRMSMDSGNHSYSSAPSSPVTKVEPTKSILKSAVRKSLRLTTPRNRVAFKVLCGSGNSASGSPSLMSPNGTPPTSDLTPTSMRIATPGSRKRASLIPRPISTTPGQSDRPSLMPMRESLIPSQPLPGGDLIDWSSPKSDSRPVRRSRRSNVC